MKKQPLPPDGVRLIQSQPDLDKLLDELAQEPLLAVDTEAASFHRYIDRVYLLQISSRTTTAVVDPLAVKQLDAFGALLANPKIEIVFHDADYDLRLLDHQYGFHAANLFDTRIAAQLVNEPGIGLAALLEKYLGLKLDKRFQRADWSARPLSTEMLAYAAKDTEYLPQLRDILRARLVEMHRLSWAEEEFADLEQVRWSAPAQGDAGFLRMKGARSLRGRSLAVLRAIYDWRERTARKADRAAFRILNNEPILAMAKEPPADLAALKAVRGIGHDLLERRGKELLEIIQRAAASPESSWPKIERPPRRASDPALDARLDRLKATRNRLAQELELPPGVVCPNGTLEAIARANPRSVAELGRVPEVRRWQARTLGKELLAGMDGPPSKTPKTP